MKISGENILTIGPSFKNYTGGIGAVLSLYSKHFDVFNLYSTYNNNFKYKYLYSLIKMLIFPFFMLGKYKIKIIHIHGASKGSFYRKYYYFIWSKYIFKKKVIYHIHGGGYHEFIENSNEIIKGRITSLFNNADKVIVLSDSWKNYFSNRFSSNNIERIYNCVEPQDISENYYKTNFEVVKFLFLGAISDKKGVFDIIDVVGELVKEGRKFIVKIGGDGQVDRIKKIINDQNLSNEVDFLGWVSGEQKQTLLLTSNVFLLPSYKEGLPISILEAMSFGMPVITTNVGGIPELVLNNDSGFIINAGNKSQLKEKMIFYLDNPNEITKMGKKSNEIIRSKFSTDILINQLNDVYNCLFPK